MIESPYVTVREAANILGITEGSLMALVNDKKLQAYRIAGQYVRFKRAEVLQLKTTGKIESETIKFPYTFKERIADFFTYNDFYIISMVIIMMLVYIMVFTH